MRVASAFFRKYIRTSPVSAGGSTSTLVSRPLMRSRFSLLAETISELVSESVATSTRSCGIGRLAGDGSWPGAGR